MGHVHGSSNCFHSSTFLSPAQDNIANHLQESLFSLHLSTKKAPHSNLALKPLQAAAK